MAPYKAEMTAQDPVHPKVSCPVGEAKLMSEHQQKGNLNICCQDVRCYHLNTPTEESAAVNDSDEVFCRICHEGPACGELLSPCQCSGSLAMVHRACLERWLTSSNSGHCELCHHQFALERLPKPLTEWWCSPSMQQQRRTLCGDAACFLFITPLASLSGWLCVQGAMDLYHTNGMEALGLLVLTVALFTIYVFWTVVSVRYHMHLFRTWKKTDQRVQLQIPPSVQRNGRKHRRLSLKLLSTATNKETVV